MARTNFEDLLDTVLDCIDSVINKMKGCVITLRHQYRVLLILRGSGGAIFTVFGLLPRDLEAGE